MPKWCEVIGLSLMSVHGKLMRIRSGKRGKGELMAKWDEAPAFFLIKHAYMLCPQRKGKDLWMLPFQWLSEAC